MSVPISKDHQEPNSWLDTTKHCWNLMSRAYQQNVGENKLFSWDKSFFFFLFFGGKSYFFPILWCCNALFSYFLTCPITWHPGFKTSLESCIVSRNYFQAALILYGQGNPIVANDNCSSEVSKMLPELLVTAPNERKKVIIILYRLCITLLLCCIPSITTGCTNPGGGMLFFWLIW